MIYIHLNDGRVWQCERVDLAIEHQLLLVKVPSGSVTITRIPMADVIKITNTESGE